MKLPEDVGTERALEALKGNLDIEYAEKNSIGHFFILPDDLRFGELWGLHNTGQTEGTPDADIDAPEAWDVFTGSSDIIVAVIDTGIAWNHVDLQANMWVNIDEIPGNEVDDDGNGYIDDYHGWNFAADPDNNWPMDDHYPWYHGTHIAGTIGASGNNHEGIAGVCWNVKLLAIKVGGYSGPDDANVARGIEYAVNNGAKISNLSVGFTYYSQTLFNAIQMARSAGHLVVAAAGNYPQTPQRDNDKTPIYPASYALDNIIAVLSTNHWDNLSSFSHYGKNSVDLGAPGGTNSPGDPSPDDILSTKLGDLYQTLYGTSMAAPHVAGVAALAFGKCPLITYGQVKTRLMNKVDILPSLNNKCVSNGRVNAYKVIFDSAAPTAPTGLSVTPTGWNTIRLNWLDNSGNEIGFDIQRRKQGQADFEPFHAGPANLPVWDDGGAEAGIPHSYRIRAYNMAGTSDFTNDATATIPAEPPYQPMNPAATWDWTHHAVYVTWDDMCDNEQFFIVERKQEGFQDWDEVVELGQNWDFHYDDVVNGDTYYRYRIKALNPLGYSYSEEVQVYIPSWRLPH